MKKDERWRKKDGIKRDWLTHFIDAVTSNRDNCLFITDL